MARHRNKILKHLALFRNINQIETTEKFEVYVEIPILTWAPE